MSRSDIEQRYAVRDGVITNPGPFYAQKAYVPYFWEAYLAGNAHEVGQDGVVLFGIHSEDLREFPELKGRSVIRLRERDRRVVEE
jgi:hypothetical protein